jgi:hypothetical protein
LRPVDAGQRAYLHGATALQDPYMTGRPKICQTPIPGDSRDRITSLTSKLRYARAHAMNGKVWLGRPFLSPVGPERMRTRTLCLAAAVVILAALPLTAPAQACQARPHSTSLCTVIPTSVEVRDEPNGRVTSDATGVVRVAGQSKDGLWARIEVPCIGFMGWIARQNLACAAPSASAQEPAKP